MIVTSRAAFAAAVRPFGPGGRLLPEHMPAFNALADALGLTAEPAIAQLGLTDADFARAAQSLGCTVPQIRAVWEVESGGGWFKDVRADILARDGPGGFLDGPNLPKILFEAHKFDEFTKGKYRSTHPNLSSAKWNRALYVGGEAEYLRLYAAMQLDREAALKSASVGGAQIMGYNHKLAGYATVDGFWAAMKRSEAAHLDAFVSFVKAAGLADKLRRISRVHADCAPFAAGYNGSGYRANQYDAKLAKAFSKWSKAA
jgi:hypothetical protein